MPLSITLVSRNNGVGLSTDMALLTEMFSQAGHRVHRVDWRVPRIAKCDVVIFLELFNPNLLKFADKSVGIFNPEWFLGQWKPWVAKLSQVWAKSESAVDIFTPMNPQTVYTGFLSRDLYGPEVSGVPIPPLHEKYGLSSQWWGSPQNYAIGREWEAPCP